VRRTIALLAVAASLSAPTRAATGDTRICKWKDNKTAAFSIGGDDSLRSQATFAIPLMTQRGIYGTWWVNTGRGHNELGFDFIDDQAYWAAAVKAGHDLASHTLHHTGARDAADAEWEIGENARRIWAIQPETRILLFERGGGTVWDTSEDQIKQLLAKYHCVDGRGARGVDSPAWLINHSAAELRGFVDAAIKDGDYHYIIFHGIGPKAEWGGQTDGDAFIALLDYLVEKRELVWSDTFTKIYKYVEERNHSTISTEATSSDVRVKLTSDLDTSKGMFDYPITLRTEVPGEWKTCTVTQRGKAVAYPVNAGVVQYSAVPNAGEISIVPGGTPAMLATLSAVLPPLPPSPPAPPVHPTRAVEDFNYSSDAELNSAWWDFSCTNKTKIALAPTSNGGHDMKYNYSTGDKAISGRLRRNTSLDLSPYSYISFWVKPSNTKDAITLQFMEAIQSEFWEATFIPMSTESQTIAIPLTKEYFRHPNWFKNPEADNLIDLSNIKLISLYVSGNGGGTVVFGAITASKTLPPLAYVPPSVAAITPALTETGRCTSGK
jgi:peptidoglycan/xylan/chitin deacetylase (PgdA/CDA1 family)